ncbi:MAG: LPS assembly protein LptD [Rhodospirillales bacterium]|nr:LPS assembly protein LptD [Alphaproteobacteria bacterium]MBL6947518.1 LPS assembly protein LptD [Rhodospirillales bacterium]
MQRAFPYRFMPPALIAVVLAVSVLGPGFASSTEAATDGVGAPKPGKPLGTLWYPGPYDPNAKPAPGVRTPIQTPTPTAEPSLIPAPPATPFKVPSSVGAPQPGKPLGTLWFPGEYAPNRSRPTVLPAPVLAPEPAPANSQPLAPVQYGKPLGTLWYPGPFDPNKPGQTAPAPSVVPGATQQTATPIPQILPAPATLLPKPIPVVPPIGFQATSPAPSPTAAPEQQSVPDTPAGDVGSQAPGDKPDTDLPVQLSADEMSYDQEQGLIVATGNVEIINGGRKLLADHISYNQKTDVVSASGNLQLFEAGGEKVFGEQMEVSGDLKDAIIKGLGLVLTDRSRIAASGARRSAGRITEMRQGVYSPCKLCEDDPTKPPLWQVKAVKVIHDKTTKTIEYRDAWLEFLGFPVAYTPYLSHPDPTVKRKSGFLAPSFGGSSDLGLVAQIPYYFNLGPNRDATITALYTADEGAGGFAEYRHRFKKGKLDAAGSLILGDSEDDIRGHIDAKGRFDIDNTWRWGFDLNRASDDTYLRRYGFGSPSSLNSRLFAEGFRQRNYFSVNAYSFQGLRATDVSETEPLVVPLLDFNHLGRPDRFGGQTVLNVNFLSIFREEGNDTRRLSIRPGWQLPFVDAFGGVYKLTAGLNVDLYQVDHLEREFETTYSGVSSRVVPEVKIDWRLPLVKNQGNVSQVIEPIAVAIYSPYGGNSTKIPNEDSTELEFDDTNLFSANKFTGLDKVEGGPRFAYGVKWGAYGKDGGKTSVFVGQSVRLKDDDTFAEGSGLEDRFSDLVGRVHVSPGPYFDLLYRTRVDSDNFIPKRNEFTFSAGGQALRAKANYVFIESPRNSEFSGREEINFSLNSKLNRFWRAGFSGVHDIAAGEARQFNASLVYENECVVFTTNASRTFYEDRDLKPSDQITVNVLLKTLGEIRTDIFQQ